MTPNRSPHGRQHPPDSGDIRPRRRRNRRDRRTECRRPDSHCAGRYPPRRAGTGRRCLARRRSSTVPGRRCCSRHLPRRIRWRSPRCAHTGRPRSSAPPRCRRRRRPSPSPDGHQRRPHERHRCQTAAHVRRRRRNRRPSHQPADRTGQSDAARQTSGGVPKLRCTDSKRSSPSVQAYVIDGRPSGLKVGSGSATVWAALARRQGGSGSEAVWCAAR